MRSNWVEGDSAKCERRVQKAYSTTPSQPLNGMVFTKEDPTP